MFDLQYWPSIWRPRISVLSHTKNILMHDEDWGRLPNSARLESLRLQADLSVCSKVLRKSIRVVFPPVHSLCFMASGLLGTFPLFFSHHALMLIHESYLITYLDKKNINSFHRKLYGSLHTFGKKCHQFTDCRTRRTAERNDLFTTSTCSDHYRAATYDNACNLKTYVASCCRQDYVSGRLLTRG